jgi:hypothetical protein
LRRSPSEFFFSSPEALRPWLGGVLELFGVFGGNPSFCFEFGDARAKHRVFSLHCRQSRTKLVYAHQEPKGYGVLVDGGCKIKKRRRSHAELDSYSPQLRKPFRAT